MSFFLKALLQGPVFESLLDLFPLVSQLERKHVARVLFVAMPAAVLPGLPSLSSPILRLRVVLADALVARRRLHPNVLVQELVCGPVVHEVLRGHEVPLLVIFLHHDLV